MTTSPTVVVSRTSVMPGPLDVSRLNRTFSLLLSHAVRSSAVGLYSSAAISPPMISYSS
jgi:hypothetical protein